MELSKAEQIAARVMQEMDAQGVRYTTLAARLGPGWTVHRVAMRLGLLMPAGISRVPLTGSELEQIAAALDVPVHVFLFGRAAEHSKIGICTLAPGRPRQDVGVCRACAELGLFDVVPVDELNAVRQAWHETFAAEQAEQAVAQ